MNFIRTGTVALGLALLTPAGAAEPAASAAGSAGSSAATKPPPRKLVSDVSCERYLQLPESARSMLIGWEVGQGYRKGSFAAWLIDPERASAVVAAVADACHKAPSASFWYTVKGELKKAR